MLGPCCVTLLLATCLWLPLAQPAWGAPAPGRPLGARPDFDSRTGDRAPVSAATRAARAALERRLGPEGFVATDPASGAVRFAGRTDGFLACGAAGADRASGADDAARIALRYVRDRAATFGLDDADLAALRLVARYRSLDGVTHLSWTQTSRGLPAYDSQLNVNVTDGGCVVNVSGTPTPRLGVPSAAPALSADAALTAAKRDVGAPPSAPRGETRPGAERRTEFSNGDHARLVVFADPDGDRLAWRLQVAGRRPYVFDLVVDADSGKVLARHSLTHFAAGALVYDHRPATGTRRFQNLAADPTWLDDSAGLTRLKGNNAHAYADVGVPDGPGPGEDVAANPDGDWIFPHVFFFPPGRICPDPGCTWNPPDRSSEAINRAQATTQLFYYVNRFHDHLLAPPIGFDEASHNFERVHTSAAPGAGDHVRAEANDFAPIDAGSIIVPPDGFSPRIQMALLQNPAVNVADDAEVVYHEYAHGLTVRLVNNGVGGGLSTGQAAAMGEGWSDWYAIDFLVGSGARADTPAPGELSLGDYLAPTVRSQAMDCPVGPAVVPRCTGTATSGPGGYTYGDLGKLRYTGSEPHDNSVIWSQTLWDLRAAVGVEGARELVTGALRLSPSNPSFLDMRNAILQADAVAGGRRSEVIWETFAARGMGVKASTASPAATSATEDFTVPRVVEAGPLRVTDAAPDGDGDGSPEPGERLTVAQDLFNPRSRPVTGVGATLSSTTPGVAIGQPDAGYPSTIAPVSRVGGMRPVTVTVPGSAACGSTVDLKLSVTTDQGAVTLSLDQVLGAPPGPGGASRVCERPPPAVVTGRATRVTRETATLEGAVHPTGTATEYAFEYGATTSYGTRTEVAPVGAGTEWVEVAAGVSGLRPGTVYHFRALALRSGEVARRGIDATFETLAGEAPSRAVGPMIEGALGQVQAPAPLVDFKRAPRLLRLDRSGRIAFAFHASPSGSNGSVSFATLGRASAAPRARFTVPPSGDVVVRPKLSRAERRTLRRRGRLRIVATVRLGGRDFKLTVGVRPARGRPRLKPGAPGRDSSRARPVTVQRGGR